MVHSFDGETPRVHESVFIAWSAEVEGRVTLEEGASVWFGAVLRADIAPITVGRDSNIQDGSVLHVDRDIACSLGEGVTVGHRAVVHACSVGNYCLIGMGAVILDRAVIGDECIVGAGGPCHAGQDLPSSLHDTRGAPQKWSGP